METGKGDKEFERYKEFIQSEINKLIPVFSAVAIGDFSKDVTIQEKEDELTQLRVGIQVMLEVIRDKIRELQALNNTLTEKMQEKTAALQEAQYLAHIGNWEWNLKNNQMYWSDEMYRIYGLRPQEMQIDYDLFINLIHNQDRSHFQDLMQDALESCEQVDFYHKIITQDGELKVLNCRAKVLLDQEGKVVKMFGTEQDMTEIKMAEETLRITQKDLSKKVAQRTARIGQVLIDLQQEMAERERAQSAAGQLAAIVETSNDAILSKDLEGNILSWNKAAETLYGFKIREIIGKNVGLIVPDEKIEEQKEIMKKLRKGERLKHFRTLRKKKGGEIIYVDLTISPIHDKEGKVIGASSIAKDISQHVRQQQQLKESQGRLTNFMNAAKDIFILADRNLKILDVNKAGMRIIKMRSKKKIVGHSINEVFSIFNSVARTKTFKNVLKDHKTVSIEEEIVDGNGVKHFYSTDVFYMHDGLGVISRDMTTQIQYEFDLNESEQKYRTLVETMNEGVLMVDTYERVQFVNGKFCEQFGYKERELLGEVFEEVCLDASDKKMFNGIRKDNKKHSTQYEIRVTNKKGKMMWMLVNSSPVFDESGKLAGYVRLLTNITQRKQYEIDLDRLAKFPAENPNPVMRYSIHGQVLVYVNKAADYLVQFFDKDETTRKKWISHINKVYENGVVVKQEIEVGSRIFHFAVVPIKEGNYINLYGTDITQAKRAEEEVRRLLFVLSQTDNSIIIANPEGKIQWVNSAFERISGYALEDVKGTRGEKLRHGACTGLDTNHPSYREMMKTKKSVSYESKNYTKEGLEYWSLTNLTPVLSSEGEIEGIVAVDADVTDKKRAEQAILKAKRIAEVSSKAKDRFLANMSHEIRTPMNAIMGIVQLLQETKLDEQQKEYLKSVDFAGENLLRIINDILDLSKIESGKLRVESVPFNLKDIMNDLINSMSHRAHEKNIDLLLEADDVISENLQGDPFRVNQILINLVSNAIKFTENGYVKLSAKRIDKVGCDHLIRFEIEDTGIGIPKKLRKLIFKEFEQVQNDLTRSHGGTGLGLSIVKRLVQLLGGRIELESISGKGSVFSVELDFKPASMLLDATGEVNWNEGIEKLRGRKVLLVEDNKLNQMVAEKFLISMGLEVDVADNGDAAINYLKKRSYDAILMDIRMPKRDGYQTTEFIRKKMKSSVPIMAMTAHALNKEEKKCFAVGMNDYITKPLKKERLFEKILNLIK